MTAVLYWRYGVVYRRDLSSRVYHLTVSATDPDDAREKAALRDPLYLASVRTPQRRGLVMP